MTKEVRSLVNYLRFLECPKCSHSAHCTGGECSLMEAADLIERMSAELDAAKRDLHQVQSNYDIGCLLCAHYVDCKKCTMYQSLNSSLPDVKLSCMDLELGECRGMINTPCNGCDFHNHWEWRGLCRENGGNER